MRLSVPASSCQLSAMSHYTSLGSPRDTGHSWSTPDCQEHPIWDNRAWGGNSGSPPSPAEPGEGWERVGHAALQSLTLNETTTQKSSASRHQHSQIMLRNPSDVASHPRTAKICHPSPPGSKGGQRVTAVGVPPKPWMQPEGSRTLSYPRNSLSHPGIWDHQARGPYPQHPT